VQQLERRRTPPRQPAIEESGDPLARMRGVEVRRLEARGLDGLGERAPARAQLRRALLQDDHAAELPRVAVQRLLGDPDRAGLLVPQHGFGGRQRPVAILPACSSAHSEVAWRRANTSK
jgi:hypothetical protein